MKKGWLAVCLLSSVMTLFSTLPAMARPSDADSNTWQMKSPESAFALGIGISADFVERDLEAGVDVLDNNWWGANIYFDPMERWHFNLFLGVTEAEMRDLPLSLSNGGVTTVLGIGETETAFGMGIGSKVDIVEFSVVPDQPKMEVFASGGYRFSNPDLDSAVGTNGLNPTILDMEVDLAEWQVGGGLKQRFDNIVPGVGIAPYIGVKYSDVDIDLNGTSSFPAAPGVTASIITGSRSSDNVIGIFLGVQILGWDERLSFAVEGRFIDESALYINSHIRW